MNKELKKLTSRITTILVLFLLFIIIVNVEENIFTEKECKNYIIEHKDEIKRSDRGDTDEWTNFKIDSCDNSYYTDITLRISSDSSYYVIFWGDRDSWKWRFKSDKWFTVDIPYNRYKGKNTELDEKILNILYKN